MDKIDISAEKSAMKGPIVYEDGETSVTFWSIVGAQLIRDVKTALRSGGGWFHGVFFFTVFAGFTAFSVGPDRAELAAAAPALLWLGAMLSLQLAASDLYASDLADGFLRTITAEQDSLAPYFFSKLVVLTLTAAMPIIVLAPVYYIVFALGPTAAIHASLVFFIGVPALIIACAVSSAISSSMRVSGLLGTALSTPIIIPVLIFGVGASEQTLATGSVISPELQLLCALILLYMVILPPFAISALRLGLE